MNEPKWTEKRVNILKLMWSQNFSMKQISEALGGVTRQAVSGKIYRLGLTGLKGVKS